MIRISICIPTYNFGKFIGETLDSILPQLTPEVEVIVLDGGSIDDTPQVMAAHQSGCSQLCYHRQEARGGIDRDIERVVGLARGDYCWLFSADDIMLPGAIKKILQATKSGYDIYLCEHVLCDIEMRPIKEYPPFEGVSGPRLFDTADEKQMKAYFRIARTSEAFFSFMAGPIFRKRIWDDAEIPDSFRGTCWIVAGHLLSVIPSGVKIQYLNQRLLHKRGNNDSFADCGLVNRCRIAIEGFQHVGDTVFGRESAAAFHIRRVLKLDIPLRTLLMAKLKAYESPATEDIAVLRRIAKVHYADPGLINWLNQTAFEITPSAFLKQLMKLKRVWGNMRGLN